MIFIYNVYLQKKVVLFIMKKLIFTFYIALFSIILNAQNISNLGLEGIMNARDFGGYQIGEKKIKTGVLYRSGNLSSATEHDLSILQDSLHIRRVYDFRTLEEQEKYPNRLQDNVLYAILPSLEDAIKRFEIPEDRQTTSEDLYINRADYYIDSISTKKVKQLAHSFYPLIIRSRVFQEQVGLELIDSLVSLPEDEAIIIHCTNGTNRAGWAVTFLLAALGADRETLIEEFLKSNISYNKYIEYAENKAKQLEYSEEQIEDIKALVGVSKRNLEEALDMIDKRYGSMDKYLESALHLTEEKRNNLKKRFLE